MSYKFQRGNVVIFSGGDYAILPLQVDEQLTKKAGKTMYKMEYKKPVRTMVYAAVNRENPIYIIGHPDGYSKNEYIDKWQIDASLLPDHKLFLCVYGEQIQLDVKEVKKQEEAENNPEEESDKFFKITFTHGSEQHTLIVPGKTVYGALLETLPQLVEEQYRDSLIANIKATIPEDSTTDEIIQYYRDEFSWHVDDVEETTADEAIALMQKNSVQDSAESEQESVKELIDLASAVQSISDEELLRMKKATFRVVSAFNKMPTTETGKDFEIWKKKLEIIEEEVKRRKN